MPTEALTSIDEQMARQTCKIGQGHTCCRYLFAGPAGLECGKLNPEMKSYADQRVATGSFTAQGDNCDGIEMLDL